MDAPYWTISSLENDYDGWYDEIGVRIGRQHQTFVQNIGEWSPNK